MHIIDVGDVQLVGRINLGAKIEVAMTVKSHESELVGSSKPAPPVFGIRNNSGRQAASTIDAAGFVTFKNINGVPSAQISQCRGYGSESKSGGADACVVAG